MWKPLQFVGDLSIDDARILERYAAENTVLEFGVGGSTQIFAQRADKVVSVETDPAWVERTKRNLALLEDAVPVTFVMYDQFTYQGVFDVVFVDGIPEKRLEFAERAWDCVIPGGCMIFHDTRRFEYLKEAAWIMQLHCLEIWEMEINKDDSNLTILHKRRKPISYVNWNETEGKPAWAYGIGERPEGEGLWTLND